MKPERKEPEDSIMDGSETETKKSRRAAIKRGEASYSVMDSMGETGERELKEGGPEYDALFDYLLDEGKKDKESCHTCNYKEKRLIERRRGHISRLYCQSCNDLFFDNIFKTAEG